MDKSIFSLHSSYAIMLYHLVSRTSKYIPELPRCPQNMDAHLWWMGVSITILLGEGDTTCTREGWLFHPCYRKDTSSIIFVARWFATSPSKFHPWHSAVMLICLSEFGIGLIKWIWCISMVESTFQSLSTFGLV